jgi:hypothetical protein
MTDGAASMHGSEREADLVREIANLLALGYMRHRKRQVRRLAVEKEALWSEKALDDVAPRGRVPLPENRTSEKGVKP